jgi:hypothetical protein
MPNRGGLGAERPLDWLAPNIESIRTVMSAPHSWFESWGELRERRKGEGHIWVDRGAKVLGVAHLDSVQEFDGLWMNHDYLSAATIDNRLGAWLMLYGLPELGMEFDVLLTDNEEYGMSTAQDYVADKEYNWMFSFDRSGDDVVCYQYDDKVFTALLESYDFNVGFGSYSDICELGHLGIKGINVGCGMYNYHSTNAYCDIEELMENVVKFKKFFEDRADTPLPHHGRKHRWLGVYAGEYGHLDATRSSLSYPPAKISDDEWDRYVNENWETLSKKPTVSSHAKWGTLDKYQARKALQRPFDFFGDTDIPDEWHVNNSLGNINDVDPDDEVGKLYNDGVLAICDKCESLFTRGDVDTYTNTRTTLCKACFYYEAAFFGPEDVL